MTPRLTSAEVESLQIMFLDYGRPSAPDLNEEEKSYFLPAMSKMKGRPAPITTEDIAGMRRAIKSYTDRTGRPPRGFEWKTRFFVDSLRHEYSEENGRCLLASTDTRKPVVSEKLISLGNLLVRIGELKKEEVDLDLLHLRSQAEGTAWRDEDGPSPALTREEILESVPILAVRKENGRKFYAVMLELSR